MALPTKMAKITSKPIVINPEAARHLINSATFDLQRDISDTNVNRLVGEMKRGWFLEGTPLTFAVMPNGQMWLMNGHHTLHAVVEAKVSLTFVGIYIQVANKTEAGRIYGRFDNHRRRSWADAYKAADLKDKVSFDHSWMVCFGSAIKTIISGFSGNTRATHDLLLSRELNLQIFEEYIPHAEAYYEAMTHKFGKKATRFKRANVMGIGVELFRYRPKKAEEFFGGASENSGLAKGDPRKALNDYLAGCLMFGQADRRAASLATAQAWNAFYSGKPLDRINLNEVDEVKLLGTPWKHNYDPFSQFMNVSPVVSPMKRRARLTGVSTGTRQEKSGVVTAITHLKKAAEA